MIDELRGQRRIGGVGRDAVGDANTTDVHHGPARLDRRHQEEPDVLGAEPLADGSGRPAPLQQDRARAGRKERRRVIAILALEPLHEIASVVPLGDLGRGFHERGVIERRAAAPVDEVVEELAGRQRAMHLAEEVDRLPLVEIAEHERLLPGLAEGPKQRLEFGHRRRRLEPVVGEDLLVVVEADDLRLRRDAPELPFTARLSIGTAGPCLLSTERGRVAESSSVVQPRCSTVTPLCEAAKLSPSCLMTPPRTSSFNVSQSVSVPASCAPAEA